MPHVGVYLGGIDVHVVHAHVVEDDIYRVHPRYRRQYGKVGFPWRRAGGVDSRSHVTPFSAEAPTETMFAPILRTSRITALPA